MTIKSLVLWPGAPGLARAKQHRRGDHESQAPQEAAAAAARPGPAGPVGRGDQQTESGQGISSQVSSGARVSDVVMMISFPRITPSTRQQKSVITGCECEV